MVKLKTFFSTIFWFPISSKNKIEKYQERIRQLEWDSIFQYIPENSSFLDVGCGAGYSLMKAHTELGCRVQGIDPAPGAHGVGRFTQDLWKERPIIEGSAEKLPFENHSFDVVYSSHVLEHVNSEQQALVEMKRVLKPGGVLIIGMPTAAMSWIGLITNLVFTTHINIYHFISSIGQKTAFKNFIRIFIPTSHSFPRAKYIGYDLTHYRITNWKKTVENAFVIEKIITPGLYPYPDYIQWFPLLKIGRMSSSVFFICKIKD
jgi:ubiquinone/menaquinone biosynthesis C-methylase UbiE